MNFLAELWRFMRVRKKFWLLPVLVMMVVFGGLVVLTKGSAGTVHLYAVLADSRCASSASRHFTTTAQPR
jgi:hypothetical protein